MIIKDSKKIVDIQREFNDKFPYLKIEFYTKEHAAGDGSKDKEKIDPEVLVSEVRSIHTSGDLSINGHLKVSSLENSFAKDYGLNAQVFRKSGGLWLQTTSTDDWTLTEQNDHAKDYEQMRTEYIIGYKEINSFFLFFVLFFMLAGSCSNSYPLFLRGHCVALN